MILSQCVLIAMVWAPPTHGPRTATLENIKIRFEGAKSHMVQRCSVQKPMKIGSRPSGLRQFIR